MSMKGVRDTETNNNERGMRDGLVCVGIFVTVLIIDALKPTHIVLLIGLIVIGVVAYLIPPKPKTPFVLYLIIWLALALNWAYTDRIWRTMTYLFSKFWRAV